MESYRSRGDCMPRCDYDCMPRCEPMHRCERRCIGTHITEHRIYQNCSYDICQVCPCCGNEYDDRRHDECPMCGVPADAVLMDEDGNPDGNPDGFGRFGFGGFGGFGRRRFRRSRFGFFPFFSFFPFFPFRRRFF